MACWEMFNHGLSGKKHITTLVGRACRLLTAMVSLSRHGHDKRERGVERRRELAGALALAHSRARRMPLHTHTALSPARFHVSDKRPLLESRIYFPPLHMGQPRLWGVNELTCYCNRQQRSAFKDPRPLFSPRWAVRGEG